MTFLPELFGNLEYIDIQVVPPCYFIAGLMQLPMITAAEEPNSIKLNLRIPSIQIGPRIWLDCQKAVEFAAD